MNITFKYKTYLYKRHTIPVMILGYACRFSKHNAMLFANNSVDTTQPSYCILFDTKLLSYMVNVIKYMRKR